MDNKRRKEQSRKQKQQDKEARRQKRASEKQADPALPPGQDPDLEGMVPGPQPPLTD
jgi:hypothetical protein